MKRTLTMSLVLVSLATLLFVARSGGAAEPNAPRKAPDFLVRDLEGRELRLSHLRGKTVVVNFWATWCPPCLHEIPWFVELQKQYAADGVEIVGISLDSLPPARIAEFAEAKGINYKVAIGTRAVSGQYGVTALPTTFYVDREGNVVHVVRGIVGKDDVEKLIRQALASGKPKK